MRKLIVAAAVGLCIFAIAAGVLAGRRSREEGAPPASNEARAAVGAGTATAPAPVLVELFTSEGCSSCPPADEVLARLAATQPVAGAEVIPLAFHVDYWNHLGWADPFSSPEFSGRQGEYARAYGKDGVYTPQMIVDGVREFPGGNGGRAAEAVASAARAPKSPVSFERGRANAAGEVPLTVRVGDLPRPAAGEAAYVLLAVTEGGLATEVRRGENSGRKLGHAGVVRRLTTLGPVAAGGGAFEASTAVAVGKNWRRENLRAVVFAQESGSRRVLAVGSVKLFD